MPLVWGKGRPPDLFGCATACRCALQASHSDSWLACLASSNDNTRRIALPACSMGRFVYADQLCSNMRESRQHESRPCHYTTTSSTSIKPTTHSQPASHDRYLAYQSLIAIVSPPALREAPARRAYVLLLFRYLK